MGSQLTIREVAHCQIKVGRVRPLDEECAARGFCVQDPTGRIIVNYSFSMGFPNLPQTVSRCPENALSRKGGGWRNGKRGLVTRRKRKCRHPNGQLSCPKLTGGIRPRSEASAFTAFRRDAMARQGPVPLCNLGATRASVLRCAIEWVQSREVAHF